MTITLQMVISRGNTPNIFLRGHSRCPYLPHWETDTLRFSSLFTELVAKVNNKTTRKTTKLNYKTLTKYYN